MVMKRIWLVALLALMMTGCSGIPTWVKDDVKDYVKEKTEQAIDRAEEVVKEELEKKKDELIAAAEEKVTEFVEVEIEKLEGSIEEKEAEAQRVVAEDLGINVDEYDIDKDGELNTTEKIPLAQEIYRKGKEKELPTGTLLMIMALALFGGDITKLVSKLGKGVLKKANGNGS
jgi:hypothetical protein